MLSSTQSKITKIASRKYETFKEIRNFSHPLHPHPHPSPTPPKKPAFEFQSCPLKNSEKKSTTASL